jgi:SAM-dependent methyltransferase
MSTDLQQNPRMIDHAKRLARKAVRKIRGRNARARSAASAVAPVEIDPREKLYEFWRQPEPTGNKPASFIDHVARSGALLAMFDRVVPREAKLLEVGCGVGRNLAYLHDKGYANLEGIEINPHAIALLRKSYPQLKDVTIHEGAAEDVLPKLADDQYNVAFTMSTLQHIHPDSVEVFDNLVRVAGEIFVIEGLARTTHRQHPHDYDALFASRGMTSLGNRSMADIPGVGPVFGEHVGRRYRRMDKQASLHEFWRQPAPPGNNPHDYVRATGRSQALLEIVSDLPTDARILEVGCNVGRNIAYLFDHGYTGVEGVEINPHAVELLRKTFPQLADREIHIGAAGETLPKFADDEFDLVYTMAVLEHIHPDESTVFDDMARIGKQVLAIEPKGRLTHRTFPHDIPKEFGDRGLMMVSDKSMAEFPSNAPDKVIHVFNAYRFKRPEGWTHDQFKKTKA